MKLAKILAIIVIAIYVLAVIALYFFQTKLIFHPGKLAKEFKFRLGPNDKEIFLRTADGEEINALFFSGSRPEVILYFHGNSGDLSGWQFVAEDFTAHGYNVLIIDYRGYGKSSGTISENGFYTDAETAYYFLTTGRGYSPQDIIVYGRSIGAGVAVEIAARHRTKGLILESAYTSLAQLANEKLPFFFPSLYLKYRFNSLARIGAVKSPVLFIHGDQDALIPCAHSKRLIKNVTSKKNLILIKGGAHNDLNSFPAYQDFLINKIPEFFSPLKIRK